MNYWQAEMKRLYETRAQLGDSLNQVELPYREMLADPIGNIQEIYRRAGTAMTEVGGGAIRAWIADKPADKREKNIYSLDRDGLTKDMVETAFAEFEWTQLQTWMIRITLENQEIDKHVDSRDGPSVLAAGYGSFMDAAREVEAII